MGIKAVVSANTWTNLKTATLNYIFRFLLVHHSWHFSDELTLVIEPIKLSLLTSHWTFLHVPQIWASFVEQLASMDKACPIWKIARKIRNNCIFVENWSLIDPRTSWLLIEPRLYDKEDLKTIDKTQQLSNRQLQLKDVHKLCWYIFKIFDPLLTSSLIS